MSRYHNAYQGAEWQRTRQAVFLRDGRRCKTCGAPGRLECHHIIPARLEQVSFFAIDNLTTLCRSCHFDLEKKRKAEDPTWRQYHKHYGKNGYAEKPLPDDWKALINEEL